MRLAIVAGQVMSPGASVPVLGEGEIPGSSTPGGNGSVRAAITAPTPAHARNTAAQAAAFRRRRDT